MIKLESGSNGMPISFGQGSTSPTNGAGFRPRLLPFEIQQVPSRVSPDLPLPLSLRPDPLADTDMSDSSRNFRGMIGIGVVLLIIFLLRG